MTIAFRVILPLLAAMVLPIQGPAQGVARAAGVCGNGIVESGEECDPGGQLRCDGNPALSACSTGAQCAGDTNCYFAFSCCKFNCQFVGQGASCFDGNECTVGDHCDNVGRCVGPFVPDGMPCSDGVFCNGTDSCQTGECAGHGGDPCEASTDCQTACNEATDSCDSEPFVPCGDDGNACTDDVCNASGTCTHPARPAGAVCRPEAGVCDVAELCPGGGAPCPVDAFLANGAPCGDQCTTNGTCQTGACVDGEPLACDDGNGCNGVETCNPATGCVAGASLDCTDGNACTADVCDPIGGCSNPLVPDGGPCDDGDLCTAVDRCVGGVCEGQEYAYVVASAAKLGSASRAAGRLIVNDPSRGVAKLGSFGFMADDSLIAANNVTLGKASSVDDVQFGDRLRQSSTATVRGDEVGGTTFPLVSGFCVLPGGSCDAASPVVVGEREVIRLTPGTYGNITILRRGTLEFDPGEYDVCGIKTASPAAIRPRGNVTLRVHGDIKVGRFGLIEPLAGGMDLWVDRKAALSTSAVSRGVTFNVPEQVVKLGRYVEFNGSVCARILKGGRAVRMGCPLAPPSAP